MTKIPSARALFSVKSLGFCAVLGLSTFCCEPLPAATITPLCNTGTVVSGNTCSGLLAGNAADPTYTLLAGNTTSYVANPPNVGWIPNFPVSEWIGPTTNAATTNSPSGDYTYQLMFTVFGTGPVEISGNWAADNEAAMYLDGSNGDIIHGDVTNNAPNSYAAWTPFDIQFDQSTNIAAGTTYDLTFVVDNSTNPSPTGLRVQFNSAPEPSTFAALGAGMVLIGFIKRKRLGRPPLS